MSADTAEAVNSDGEEEMDVSGDEYEATEEQVATEASMPSQLHLNASRWDCFLDWARAIETP